MKSIIAQELERLGSLAPVVFDVTFADGARYQNREGPPSFSVRDRKSVV